MDQQTPQTIKAGALAKDCFKNEQERLEAYTAAMIVSAFVGPQGATGDSGATGADAENPDWEIFLERTVPIAAGSEKVSAGGLIKNKILVINANAAVVTTATAFGVACCQGTTVWFSFNGGAVSVTGDDFTLEVYGIRRAQ